MERKEFQLYHIIKSILTDVLTALYQSVIYSIILTYFISYYYLYTHNPIDTGKGIKAANKAWFNYIKESSYFRRLILLILYTSMIIFKTLLYRGIWINPLEDVMGGWWIWKISDVTGKVVITTECFENVMLFIPFTIILLLVLTEAKRLLITGGNILWFSAKVSFCFSISIECTQLLLRLGTWQLSDLFYNTLGGFIGGLIYWIGYRIKHKK